MCMLFFVNAVTCMTLPPQLVKAYGEVERLGKITGESTASYLEDVEHSISRIKRACGGGVRFILMLRDPIARARSLFHSRVRDGIWRRCEHVAKPADLTELVRMDIANSTNSPFGHCTEFIESAKYAAHIREALRYFDPSQFMVVFTEQLHEHAAAILNQVRACMCVAAWLRMVCQCGKLNLTWDPTWAVHILPLPCQF